MMMVSALSKVGLDLGIKCFAKKHYAKLAKLHARTANIRKDFLNKTTTDLVEAPKKTPKILAFMKF